MNLDLIRGNHWSISWDTITVQQARDLMEENGGYFDGDKRTVEIYLSDSFISRFRVK